MPARMSTAVCLLGLLTLTAGCGETKLPEPATAPTAVVPTSESTPEANRPLTASELREKLGASANARFEKVSGKFVGADLTESGVSDISALRGLPLKSLSLLANPIADLTPVEGMPLEVLQLRQTRIADLSPLKGMALKDLDISETQVADLAPLAGMQLKQLDLSQTKVASLAALEGMPLEQLWFVKAPVESLAPLTGMSLTTLWCRESRVSDLSPLIGMPLRELNLCQTGVTDLTPLKGMELQTLWLRDTRISDLTPLIEIDLASIDLQGTDVVDLKVVAQFRNLKRLNIAGTGITDLRPLQGLLLERLILTPSRITEGLDIVRGIPTLRELDIEFEGINPARTPATFWAAYDAGEFAEKK